MNSLMSALQVLPYGGTRERASDPQQKHHKLISQQKPVIRDQTGAVLMSSEKPICPFATLGMSESFGIEATPKCL